MSNQTLTLDEIDTAWRQACQERPDMARRAVEQVKTRFPDGLSPAEARRGGGMKSRCLAAYQEMVR